MPRLTRAQKDARKAKAEALKASETSTSDVNNGNSTVSTNCGTSSHLVSTLEETRVLISEEKKQKNLPKSNASEAVQDTKFEKSTGVVNLCRVERATSKITTAQKDARKAEAEALKASETSTSDIKNDNTTTSSNCGTSSHLVSTGEETRILVAEEKKQENATKSNASEAMQDKKPEKCTGENEKERSDGGQRGPSRKTGEEETVSLRPSQLESKQKQREERSSFAGNKGSRQDFNGRNLNASQNFGGYNSRLGAQHGYYDNRGSGPGGYNEGDSGRVDALGRALSLILRHKAPQLGLKVRSDGYVVVKDLLSLHTKTPAGLPLNAHSVDDLKEAVKRDNKQRFGLCEENGQLLIRANQGHSLETINSIDLLEQVLSADEVPVCIHGTYMRYLESIRKEGLKCMRRNHVHFATGYFRQNGVISGVRKDSEVVIHMDVSKYLNDGMKLYRSENGVILAEGRDRVVPPEYFSRIEVLAKKRKNNL